MGVARGYERDCWKFARKVLVFKQFWHRFGFREWERYAWWWEFRFWDDFPLFDKACGKCLGWMGSEQGMRGLARMREK